MLNASAIKELAARRQLLVAESESHRRALGLELAQLQSTVGAVAHPLQSALSLSRILALGAPLAGLFLGRAKGRSGVWVKMGLLAWQLFQKVRPLWAGFRMRRRDRE